jgi:hypothetical protein
MSYATRALGVAMLAVALSGCVVAVGNRGEHAANERVERHERNRMAIDRLQLGSPIELVIADLGAAEFSEAFVRDGRAYRVLHYRTHAGHRDEGRRRGTTPVVFVDGKLVGWGEAALR